MAIQKQTLMIASLVAVIAFSGISIWRQSRPAVPRLGMDVMQVCGEVAGEETVKLLGGKGRVVVLRLKPGKSNDRMKSIQARRLEGFETALKAHGQIQIIAVKDVLVEENSVETGIVFPAHTYREMIDAYADADAIVCLAGNPFSGSPALADQPGHRPKGVLLEIIPQGVEELIDRGVVDVAFVLCQSSPPAPDPPKTPREWFGRMYQVVTRNNYKGL